MPVYADDPSVLAGALARKRRDTARGLAQIARHYRERYWWGLWGRWLASRGERRGGRLRESDFVGLPLLERLGREPGATTYAVIVELDADYPGLEGFSARRFRAALADHLGANTWVGAAADLPQLLAAHANPGDSEPPPRG